jgi:hypothetical protein
MWHSVNVVGALHFQRPMERLHKLLFRSIRILPLSTRHNFRQLLPTINLRKLQRRSRMAGMSSLRPRPRIP